MARKKMQREAESKAITVRVKPEEYEIIKKYADAKNASLNTVVCEAIAQYGTRIRRRQVMEDVKDLQRRIRERFGVGTDSAAMIREAREERAEQLESSLCPAKEEPDGGKKQ